MIVLDTNVVSEPLKPQRSRAAMQWLDAQVAETLYVAAPSLAEIWLGIDLLPQGRRRSGFEAMLTELAAQLFAGRVLPFDAAAARAYGRLVALARGGGATVSVIDAEIAAIAASRGFTVATRDTAPFLAMGVPVIHPWEAGAVAEAGQLR